MMFSEFRNRDIPARHLWARLCTYCSFHFGVGIRTSRISVSVSDSLPYSG